MRAKIEIIKYSKLYLPFVEDRRSAIVKQVFDLLTREGFRVSDPLPGGTTGFDIIAKRESLRLIIKVLQNIDTLRNSSALELIRISKLTYAAPLVVGRKAGGGPLEHGVIYFRHRVPILSPETFQDYLEGEMPFISSGPGGFYASIDGKRLHQRREELGYSIGYLSNKIGTSRRSISLYESGSAVTIDVYLKLEEVLGEDLGKSIDLLDVSRNLEMPPDDSPMDNDFLSEVLNLMMIHGMDFHPVRKFPFDAVMKETLEEIFLIGLMESLDRNMVRITSMRNISQIFENDSFVISRLHTTREHLGGCPVINLAELRDIREKEKLQILIEKRKLA